MAVCRSVCAGLNTRCGCWETVWDLSQILMKWKTKPYRGDILSFHFSDYRGSREAKKRTVSCARSTAVLLKWQGDVCFPSLRVSWFNVKFWGNTQKRTLGLGILKSWALWRVTLPEKKWKGEKVKLCNTYHVFRAGNSGKCLLYMTLVNSHNNSIRYVH